MKTIHVAQPKQSSTNQDGPFRPLYVESEAVKSIYELTQLEVFEAIVEWMSNHHGINTEYGHMEFAYKVDNGRGNVIDDPLEKYTLSIVVGEKDRV